MSEQDRWERKLDSMTVEEVARIWGFMCRYLRRRIARAR